MPEPENSRKQTEPAATVMNKLLRLPALSAFTAGIIVTLLLGAVPQPARAAAQIVINNLDAPGEGFNDPAPFAPAGGNYATTLGQARLNAFQYAANIIGQYLNSTVPIVVDARFVPLGGDATSAVLAQAGPVSIVRDFGGAPAAATWYPVAVANAIAGADLVGGSNDIVADFNSDVDGAAVLSGIQWYYGLDANPEGQNIDLVSVVLHELIHGLGFTTFADVGTGALYVDSGNMTAYDDAFIRALEYHPLAGAQLLDSANADDATRATAFTSGMLHWIGPAVMGNLGLVTSGLQNGHVPMYAPSTVEPGSSVSHFDTSLVPAQLMAPFFTSATHDPSLAIHVLSDIGWAAAGGGINKGTGTADLVASITPAQAAGFDPGASVNYTVTATNVGLNTAVSAAVTFFQPPGSTFVSAVPSQGTCAQANNIVSCFVGDIAPAGNVTVAISLTLGSGASARNATLHTASAKVTSTTAESDGTDNTAVSTLTNNPPALKDLRTGGGCTVAADNGRHLDPLLPALLVLASLGLLRRRRQAT